MRRGVRGRWVVQLLAAPAALAGLVLTASPAAPAAAEVDLEVLIDGRRVEEATEREPIRLYPDRPAMLDMRVTNGGAQAIEVRTFRLEGRVMALTFFAYDTAVGMPVGPGTTETRRFALDLVGIDGQATGLIRGSVSVLDPRRDKVASRRLVLDVRGSLWSVYGVFGLTVAALTAIALVTALVAMARHQLPENRWRRAVSFLTPGLGLGLLLVFTLSALRLFVPQPNRWVPILLISAGAFFLLGYVTPTPDEDEEQGDEEEGEAVGAARETERPSALG
jgi:hypothetical protein